MRSVLFIGILFSVQCFATTQPISGTLYPSLKTNVSTGVSGRVHKVFVGVGSVVEKGQVLAQLDPLFFEIECNKCETAVELAKLGLEDAKSHYGRMKRLWEKEDGERASIPKSQLDAAKSGFKQAKLLLDQALLTDKQIRERFNETKIKAPYDGVITGCFVDPGESVMSMGGAPLFEIMDISTLVFEFSLPQNMLTKVKTGLQISSEQGSSLGIINAILPQIDVSSRSFKCRTKIDNKSMSLKPGSFVTATIELEAEE